MAAAAGTGPPSPAQTCRRTSGRRFRGPDREEIPMSGRMTRRPLLVVATALVLPGQPTRMVRPKEIDSVLVNPGIGFTTLNRFNGDPLNQGTKWTEGHPIEDFPFNGKLEVAGQPLTSI